MSENRQSELFESLSALADGEATELELRRILKDEDDSEALRGKWGEYHQVGNLLRKEPHKGVDISAAVMDAVQDEAQPGSIGRFFKPFGQVAVAASVAAFALFGVQQYQLAQLEPAALNDSVAEIEPLNSSDAVEFAPPIGFEVRPQTSLVSTNPEASNISDDVRLQIPFDQRALYEHVNQSILLHSENAAEATQDIYPMLRVPAEN